VRGQVLWDTDAQRDLDSIWDFIATDNPAAANGVIRKIFSDAAPVLRTSVLHCCHAACAPLWLAAGHRRRAFLKLPGTVPILRQSAEQIGTVPLAGGFLIGSYSKNR